MNPTNLPNEYWAEAIHTAVFLSSLSPTYCRNNKYPQFLWRNVSPILSGFRTFGCQLVIYNLKTQQNWKLSSPGQEGILLGFENEGTAYRILRLDDLKVLITRNVTFNERVFPSVLGKTNSAQWTIDELLSPLNTYTELQREGDSPTDIQDSLDLASHQENNLEDLNDSDQSNEEQTNQLLNEPSSESLTRCHDNLNNEIDYQNCGESANAQKDTRVKVIGPHHPTLITSNVDSMHIVPYSQRATFFLTIANDAPKTYQTAIQGKIKLEWESAIKKELLTMKKLEIWDVVKLRSDYKLVGTTWVFKVSTLIFGNSV
ncbi:hypothetical protein O181_111478 [Austropuccinia psidii MF-1]|uniref:Retroviral polymerase SH3-like domain-containing protein n=1 Tax=Austropuccinia psidii MF-1 TaxID=1389203 RepID=A0A9Q3JYL5_9BASI|nr:hypothetical protein [Austropuccinia psidii MF-1]